MRTRSVIWLAALALFSCGKTPEEGTGVQTPLAFQVTAGELESKAQLNRAMGTAYDTNESFVVYAAYSDNSPFDPASCTDFWDNTGLVTGSYDSNHHAWMPHNASAPSVVYYWPRAGYLTFQAYSPAGATGITVTHDWATGFNFDFTVPAAGSQYDLLYSTRVESCRRADYTVTDSNGYDDDPDYPTHIYNGVNLAFNHALSLIEVQVSSSLGANASTKFYVQKIELRNAYNQGTFAQSTSDQTTGTWTVNTSAKVDYTVLNKGVDGWQEVPGADESPVSVNPLQTLMLLPQELDRTPGSTPDYTTDAYLYITYKEGSTGALQTSSIPLTDPWVRGNKYTYRLVFSSYIEFTATITPWADAIRGEQLIII